MKEIFCHNGTTLYVTDLDGTLLGTDSKISPRSSDLISRLTGLGAMIGVATARTAATVVPLFAGTATSAPFAVMTGAALWNRDRRSYSELHFMPPEEALKVNEIFRREGLTPFIYTLPRKDAGPDGQAPVIEVYKASQNLTPTENRFYSDRAHLRLKHFNIGEELSEKESGHTLLFFDDVPDKKAEAVARAVMAETRCSACAYPDIAEPGLSVIEVLPPGVSKASAVKELKRVTGADRLVIFGDNLNDLAMLAEADVAVAVENAHPEVKAAADIVTGPNTADAVPRFIWRDYLGKEL